MKWVFLNLLFLSSCALFMLACSKHFVVENKYNVDNVGGSIVQSVSVTEHDEVVKGDTSFYLACKLLLKIKRDTSFSFSYVNVSLMYEDGSQVHLINKNSPVTGSGINVMFIDGKQYLEKVIYEKRINDQPNLENDVKLISKNMQGRFSDFFFSGFKSPNKNFTLKIDFFGNEDLLIGSDTIKFKHNREVRSYVK